MMLGAAVMTNVRQIMRYSESPESKKETDKTEKACQDNPFFSYWDHPKCVLLALFKS
jgi:hypothetical protein